MIKLKTLFRSPLKTALTFVLLSVVTFALFTQITEYAVASRERRNTAKMYYGTGTVEIKPPNIYSPLSLYDPESDGSYVYRYQPLSREQIDAISELPYISSTDARYMTAGVSGDYERIFRGQKNRSYSERRVIEGTLTHINVESTVFVLTDAVFLAGSLPWENVQRSVHINYYGHALKGSLTVGERYAFVVSADKDAFHRTTTAFLAFDPAALWCDAIWRVDGRDGSYLGADEYEPLRTLIDIIETDIRTYDVVYTSDMGAIRRFADGDMLIRYGRALDRNDDQNATRVCVVSRDFSRNNGVGVGDFITIDTGAKWFEQYSTLGALSVIHPRYEPPGEAVALEIVGVYIDVDELSKRNSEPNLTYSINTIFVPGSLFALTAGQLEGHSFTPAEFNFKIADARNLPAFVEECVPVIEGMGLKLTLNDGGWLEIAGRFKESEKLPLTKMSVFAAAVFLSTGFAVYLFIGRKKTEYSIMRALGVAKRPSALALAVPLLVVAAASVLTGVAAAWLYVAGNIGRSDLLLSLGLDSFNTAIPAEIVLGCAFGEVLLTLLFALAFLLRLGAIPPLLLLQSGSTTLRQGTGNAAAGTRGRVTSPRLSAGRRGAVTDADAYVGAGAGVGVGAGVGTAHSERSRTLTQQSRPIAQRPSPPTVVPALSPAVGSATLSPAGGGATLSPAGNSGSRAGFVLSCVWRHLRRAAGKSVLAVLLASILFAVVGRFAQVRASYIDIIETSAIKARLVGGARLSLVPKIMESGYIRESYYAVSANLDLNEIMTSLTVTGNYARFIGEDVSIEYADGYDTSSLSDFNNTVFIGADFAEVYGIKPGDKVSVRRPGLFDNAMNIKLSSNWSLLNQYSEEEARELLRGDVEREVEMYTDYFTVAGTFTSPSGRGSFSAFTPGSMDSVALMGVQSLLNEVEYTLRDNLLADEFREYCEESIGGVSTGRTELIMDTSKIDGAKRTLKLFDMLSPIIYAAALLIGCLLCCIITLQSQKEAALMRVLGTTRPLTGTLLSLEQSLLAAAGLILGACALLVISSLADRAPSAGGVTETANALAGEIAKNAARGAIRGAASWEALRPGLLFALLYFAVTLASTAVCYAVMTRRSVLSLLQTRE